MTTLNQSASDTHLPVRSLCLPNPPAQTVFGILDSSGGPTSSENITTLGPHFDWMSGIEIYMRSVVMSLTDRGPLKDGEFHPTYKGNVQGVVNHPHELPFMDWHLIPFTCSKFWSGTVQVRFLALKPPRVTGKVMIRFQPDFSTANFQPGQDQSDDLRRGVKMEWDLGLSNDFVMDIPAFSLLKLRPTWIPRFSPADTLTSGTGAPKRMIAWTLPFAGYSLGKISMEVAQPLQPGSIFPDSIRILIFHSFKGSSYFMPTDCRGINRHVLTLDDNDLTLNNRT